MKLSVNLKAIMKNRKIFPVILLIAHLMGVAITSFHYHDHLCQKKYAGSFIDLPPYFYGHHDSEENCAICYFSIQHNSCQPQEYKEINLDSFSLTETLNYSFHSQISIYSIPQRAPPKV